MQTKRRPTPVPTSIYAPSRRKRVSPLLLIGASVPVVLALIFGAVFVLPNLLQSHAAAAANPNCTLIAPPGNILSAQGLATPWVTVGTNAAANGPCNQANNTQTEFVQGAVIDPATGQISIYDPLVIDQGTKPAAAPVVPTLPANAVVALWGGFQGTTTTLQATGNNLANANCVNGAANSPFGEFWYCNAPNFFKAANAAIQAGKLQIPALGTGKDGKTCPTVRDFGVVDMDQSDNVTTTYIITKNGTVAQNTAANVAALQNTMLATNASDNRLLSVALDGALGCTSWMAPNLADPGKMEPALPLDELQAAAMQAAPVAQVPAGDPMAMVNANMSLNKTNLYRAGVDQTPAQSIAANANTTTYCNNLLNTAPARLKLDMPLTMNAGSPAPAVANNLFTFLAQRFVATFEGAAGTGLNCMNLLKKPDPVKVTMTNGVVTAATITLANAAANANQAACPAANGQQQAANGQQVRGHKKHNAANGQQQPAAANMPAATATPCPMMPAQQPAANNNMNQAQQAACPAATAQQPAANGQQAAAANGQQQAAKGKQTANGQQQPAAANAPAAAATPCPATTPAQQPAANNNMNQAQQAACPAATAQQPVAANAQQPAATNAQQPAANAAATTATPCPATTPAQQPAANTPAQQQPAAGNNAAPQAQPTRTPWK